MLLPGSVDVRVAVISDLHGNLEATRAVLEDIEARGIADILCAGDLVNYGPDPNGVVELIRARAIPCVMGNHDLAAVLGRDEIRVGPGRDPAVEIDSYQWTVRALTGENKEFLGKLPLILRWRYPKLTVAIVHATPWSMTEYLRPSSGYHLWKRLAAELPARAILAGHTHEYFSFELEDILVCNPGSVGKPKDGDPRASYGILEIGNRPRFERIKVAYNLDETSRKIKHCGLPETLVRGLLEARDV